MEIKSLDEVKKLMKKYKEIWVTIPYYPDYQISNFGRVKSFKGKTEKILKPRYWGVGYMCVALSNEKVKSKNELIHRLVGKIFLPNMADDCEINHIDENKSNNVVIFNKKGEIIYSNLEWVSSKENINWGTRTERATESRKINKNRRIIQYTIDGELVKVWNSLTELCKTNGWCRGNIQMNLKGTNHHAYHYVFKYAE